MFRRRGLAAKVGRLMLLVLAVTVAWNVSPAPAAESGAVGCSFCGHPPRPPWHYRRCRLYDAGLNSGGTAPAVDQQMQVVQAMMPILQGALENMFRTDPAEEARRRQAAAEAATKAAEEAERRRAEEERRRREAFERLKKELKLSEDFQDLKLKGLEGEEPLKLKLGDGPKDDDGLRPKGTPLFGLGGEGTPVPPEALNDPKVVDLRNCRRAAFLAGAAAKAPLQDAERLMDEAVRGAQGDASFVADPPAGAVPVVSEAGLLAFHKANIAYAKARDSRLHLDELFKQAQLRRELADKAIRIKKAEIEKKLAENAGQASREEQRRLLAELFAAAKAEQEAWLKARAETAAARSREAFDRAVLQATLPTVAAAVPPKSAEVLRQELEALSPTLPERIQHERCWVAAQQFAEAQDAIIQARYELVTDPKQEDRLNALTERIRRLLPYGNERLDVKIIGAFKDPDPTAYDGLDRNVVTTGRTIYFGRDYLAHQPTDDELLYMIGHETAHAQRDHNYLYDKHFQPEIKDLDDLLRGGKIDLPQDREQLYMDIRMHRLNYEQETQADRLGAAMAQGAGAKPEGIRDAFSWMAKEEAFMSKLPEYARTHPKPLDRYKALLKIWSPVWGEMK